MSHESLPDFDPSAKPTRRRSRLWLWVLLFIPLSGFGLVIIIIGAATLLFVSSQEQPVTNQDREVVVDMDRVGDWLVNYSADSQQESFTKTRYIDGSYEVDYEYDAPDDPEAPYLTSSVTVERNVSDAITTYLALWGGAQLGMTAFSGAEVKVIDRDDLFQWGDQSRFAILESDGQPIGNMFISRKGRHVFYVLVSGVYFDDRETISELLSEPLAHLPAYKP